MKRLIIPESEKAKGLMWVEYLVCQDKDYWLARGIAELEIRQGIN